MTNSDNLLYNIGLRIRELREYCGMSREELAEASDLTVSFITQIERGQKGMSILSLIKLSRVLGVTTDYLLEGKIKSEYNAQLLYTMMESLPPEALGYAEELLKVYVLAISNKQSSKKDIKD